MLQSIERRGRNRIGEAAAVAFKAGKQPYTMTRSFPDLTAIGDTIRTRSGLKGFFSALLPPYNV
ncbi:hypothetical protein D5F53_01910 [Paenibacillus lautus]|uniref:Uncharacterized protein n=1 Tax=Paenibacillus lautus TaxID=1401 RepID=A0A385TI56_PAELA|nr:hypothetical protein D5F53_01910 [Paenibacillus lautus]